METPMPNGCTYEDIDRAKMDLIAQARLMIQSECSRTQDVLQERFDHSQEQLGNLVERLRKALRENETVVKNL